MRIGKVTEKQQLQPENSQTKPLYLKKYWKNPLG